MRCIINTEEHEKPLSGFGSEVTRKWSEGDTVEVEVTESNGYLNFSLPKVQRNSDTSKLEVQLGFMANHIKEIQKDIRAIKLTLDIASTEDKVNSAYDEEPGNPFPDNAPPISDEDVPW